MTDRSQTAAGRPQKTAGPPGPAELVPCPLCEGVRARAVAVKFGLRIVRCRSCGHVFANPRLLRAEIEKRYESPEFFSEYLDAHRATPKGYDLDFLRGHYGLYLDLIRGRLSPGARLLDLGCGAGFFLKAAEADGWAAEGTEISRQLAAYARDVAGVKVRLGTLEEIRWPPEIFDVVTLFDVLEHVPDPLRTLTEVGRLLKTDGAVLISTPDYDSLSRLFLGKAWAVLSPAEHLSLFTSGTLRALIERAGLSVLAIRNLLVFNPDYTHRKGLRHSLWKRLHGRLARTRLAARLRNYDTRKVSAIEPVAKAGGGPRGLLKKMRTGLYGRSRKIIRGDILVALAQKRDRPRPLN